MYLIILIIIFIFKLIQEINKYYYFKIQFIIISIIYNSLLYFKDEYNLFNILINNLKLI